MMTVWSSGTLDFDGFCWILRVREGLESIWNCSGIHVDEFSVREVEYGVVLKHSDDFEQFSSILDSPEASF